LREHPEAFGSSYEEEEERPLEEWQARLQPSPTADHGYFGAFAEGVLVGIIGYYRRRGAKLRHKGTIVSMYVRPEHRGKGVAADLIVSLIAWVREHTTIEQLQLAVVNENRAARRLYERLGFIPYAEEQKALKIGTRYYDETYMYFDINKGTE
jgi:RimJ/RimL family protein N-acetyltransferase